MSPYGLLPCIGGRGGIGLQGQVLVTEAMADMTGMTLMLDLAKQEESFDSDAVQISITWFNESSPHNLSFEPRNIMPLKPYGNLML